MLRHERSAPIWLFSFVDLAFLLLIAFTQIGSDDSGPDAPLADVELPRLHGPEPADAGKASAADWQLRVRPAVDVAEAEAADRAPFLLVEPGRDPADVAPIGGADLADRLALLGQRGQGRPLLAPHPDARAEDLLVAADLVETVWRAPRRAIARPGNAALPIAATPTSTPQAPVAAGPPARTSDPLPERHP